MTALPNGRPDDEIHPLGIVNAILRQRRLVVGVVLLALIPTAVLVLAKRRQFTTTASFTVQGRRQNSLQGLASQFGLGPLSVESGQSPIFFLDLLQTRQILGPIVDSVGSVDSLGRKVPLDLAQLWQIRESAPALRREHLIMLLKGAVHASIAQRTGVVSLTVTTNSAPLSVLIAQRIIDELNHFNSETRQSQASAELRFSETRLREVSAELRESEERLLDFTLSNRDIRSAPPLQVRQERLQRDVLLRQQVVSSLAQSVEQARIERVRDTPVISVVERPSAPPLPDGRGLTGSMGLAAVLGGLFGVLIALVRDRDSALPTPDHRTEEFKKLRKELLQDLIRPWRLLSRR